MLLAWIPVVALAGAMASALVSWILAVFEDRSALRRVADELRTTANLDPLTGLQNRTQLSATFDDMILGNDAVLVAVIDLDNFKAVNDERGHRNGDHVLVETARRLQGSLRAGDHVFRVGGDEFVMLVAVEPGALDTITIERRIAAGLTRGDHPDERPIAASIGVVMADKWEGFDDVIHRADTAMYEAKARSSSSIAPVSERRIRASRISVGVDEARTVDISAPETLSLPGTSVAQTDVAARLALVARSLNGRLCAADIIDIIVRQGLAILHADGGVFAVERGGQLIPVEALGASVDIVDRLGAISIDAPLPIALAARTRTGVWLPDPETTNDQFPLLHLAAPGFEAWAAVPVLLDDQLVGVFGFCFSATHQFAEMDRLYIRALADMSARPLEEALRTAPDEANSALLARADELIATSLERSAIVAAITHDLRMPLAAIALRAGALPILHDRGDSRRLAEESHRIEHDADEMSRLLALLDVAKHDDPFTAVPRTSFDLYQRARRAVDSAFGDRSNVRVLKADARSTQITANQFQIERLVANLVANAIRHAPDGTMVDVTIAGSDSHVTLTVDDGGAGVPDDRRSSIFEAYVSTSTDPSNRGLGLYIVRQFAVANGAELRLSTAPLGGARFEVIFAADQTVTA